MAHMVYVIYLGLNVFISEPVWARSIYHIATWSLWLGALMWSSYVQECPYYCGFGAFEMTHRR